MTSFFYFFICRILKIVFYLCYRHKTVFLDQKYPKGAALIVANHASFIDPPLIAVSWPEEVHFLAEQYLFKNPFFRWLIQSLNAHPISRSRSSNIDSIKMVTKLLMEGKKVVIFPEGTRSKDGFILPFKNGFAYIAQRVGCPIIPVYIHGSATAWPRNKKWPNLRGETSCIVGHPIYWKIEVHLDRRNEQTAMVNAVFQSIVEMQKEYGKIPKEKQHSSC